MNSHVPIQNIKPHIHNPPTHLHNLEPLRARRVWVSIKNHIQNNLHFMQNKSQQISCLLAHDQQFHRDTILGDTEID